MMTLDCYLDAVASSEPCEQQGRVTGLVGLVLRACVPGARSGEICVVRHRTAGLGENLLAEVVGFHSGDTLLMPLGDASGVALGSAVRRTQAPCACVWATRCLGACSAAWARQSTAWVRSATSGARWRRGRRPRWSGRA
ncbi:MAG: hypothetical protein WKF30_14925 [Pyrinomonadaceae bacterium]